MPSRASPSPTLTRRKGSPGRPHTRHTQAPRGLGRPQPCKLAPPVLTDRHVTGSRGRVSAAGTISCCREARGTVAQPAEPLVEPGPRDGQGGPGLGSRRHRRSWHTLGAAPRSPAAHGELGLTRTHCTGGQVEPGRQLRTILAGRDQSPAPRAQQWGSEPAGFTPCPTVSPPLRAERPGHGPVRDTG